MRRPSLERFARADPRSHRPNPDAAFAGLTKRSPSSCPGSSGSCWPRPRRIAIKVRLASNTTLTGALPSGPRIGRSQPSISAQQDVPDRFLISQKLYGRDREVAELLRAFDETCEGRTGLMLVSGYSGIGKTSLIHELYKPIVRQRGYVHRRQVRSGRAEHPVRCTHAGIPQPGLAAARRERRASGGVARRGCPMRWAPTAASWRRSSPRSSSIIGKQARAAAPLEPTEAQNRFRLCLQRFVSALARTRTSAGRVPRRPAVGRRRDARPARTPLLTGPGIQPLAADRRVPRQRGRRQPICSRGRRVA